MARQFRLPNAALIALLFLAAILLGTALLLCPLSARAGQTTSFMDALFTATTSVCVTGLVTVTTAAHWSVFGQIVILLLIQLGGLGIVTVVSAFYFSVRKRSSLGQSLLLSDVFNAANPQGMRHFLWRMVRYTFAIEGFFFLTYIPVFVSRSGAAGIWQALFHSVSTFCNAGIDILGGNSLADYSGNVYFLLLTMLEIVLGGLGFILITELKDKLTARLKGHRQLISLHAKFVLWSTGIFLAAGWVLFLLLEFRNPDTLGNMPLWKKILNALFESVTLRTAGFATFPQSGLTDASAFVARILMFIGGSPTGTAGGVKTVTVAALFLSALFSVTNRDDLIIASRRVRLSVVKKALCVFTIALIVNFAAILIGMAVTGESYRVISFEVMSALGTVGLSMDYTPALSAAGKWLIIVCMYLGRIGPFSILLIFSNPNKTTPISYAEEDIVVG